MDVVQEALVWLNDPLNWTGPDGVPALTAEHLGMSLMAVLLAALVALPLGIWLGHRGSGGTVTVVVANATRALPTLALLLIFATTGLGFGNRPTVIAAAIFAIPPILSNTYTGLLDVDPAARDAARGMGMSGLRSLVQVELPLALPLVGAGLRTSAIQVIATIPLAALVGGGGLGVIINNGFALQRYGQVLAGGVLVAVLCLVAEGVLGWGQRLLTPAPMRARAAQSRAAAA
ncbi:ABC transporter permease [Actinotalea sp. M2MS4P-6]|uniref:ABC transporter permease n=1 Tax=Actinotalea sp. M2MS4P-6 TaxID=2983762 RepID=UPI0021E4A031|nr:ABC transporter permease [Actinotalea sp. M2MS4P-6]MCV2396173.1 ABC transporter permease [Actinotalea sp. M2MS4P-6]